MPESSPAFTQVTLVTRVGRRLASRCGDPVSPQLYLPPVGDLGALTVAGPGNQTRLQQPGQAVLPHEVVPVVHGVPEAEEGPRQGRAAGVTYTVLRVPHGVRQPPQPLALGKGPQPAFVVPCGHSTASP